MDNATLVLTDMKGQGLRVANTTLTTSLRPGYVRQDLAALLPREWGGPRLRSSAWGALEHGGRFDLAACVAPLAG